MKVLNIKDAPINWKNDNNYVYCGRPSKFGNPFSSKENSLAQFKVKNRTEAIQKHWEWLLDNEELCDEVLKLEGKTLLCFCKPKACHCDNFVKLLRESKGLF